MTRQEIIENIKRKGSFLCVGLDTDVKKLPAPLQGIDDAAYRFNCAIIDATAPYCVAYKPNTAFYEAQGIEGWSTLQRTVDYIRDRYPDQFIIADAKRGDIGNTSELYARAFFDQMGVDALTVAPYMGQDSVTPFLKFPGHWVVLLALTSNPGSRDFQFMADPSAQRLFERVLEYATKWGTPENMMFVVGATQGMMFTDVRRIAPDNFLLVPGVGAQGGSLEQVAKWGMTSDCGLIVNSSRGIIYASSGDDYAEAAAAAARRLRDEMTMLLSTHGVI